MTMISWRGTWINPKQITMIRNEAGPEGYGSVWYIHFSCSNSIVIEEKDIHFFLRIIHHENY